jgi:NAD-specific glutamate dehydrogenase
MNKKDSLLISRLNEHSQLRQRIEELLNVVDNAAGDCTKANEAEQRVIDELRKMGNDALSCWAEKAVKTSIEAVHQEHTTLTGDGKKKSAGTAHLEKSE